MNIEDINKQIKGLNPLALPARESQYSRIDEWISTGNYLLNAAMSGDIYGGVPNNRITCFAGESGCLYKGEKITVYKMKTKIKNRSFIGREFHEEERG
jgi:hypothetical protein